MNSHLKELEERIAYEFKNKNLFTQALTHSSYANEHRLDHSRCNERLEFLGDAVLEIVTSEFLYRKYETLPEGDLTKKQIKRLRKASSIFVRDELCQSLQRAVTETGMEKWLLVEADPDGEGDGTYPEPRVIHIRYRSLFDEDLPYLHSEVKLEVGARSLLEPTAEATVTSIVEDALPISTIVKQVVIPTALAEKTFLEKAFLLHELFSSQTSREANRKSRHLYDLAQMMSTDIATRAIANDELWNTIHHHRELFTSMSGVDYTPDIRKRIRLLPPDDVMDDWYND